MGDDSLTGWMVGVGGTLLVAGATAAVKLFAGSVTAALAAMRAEHKEHHDEVVKRLDEVAQRVGEHSAQLAVVHHQLGQHDQELKDLRVRIDSLATYWQRRMGGE